MSNSRIDRIKDLEEKKKQIEARIQKLKAIESAKKRKEDTTRISHKKGVAKYGSLTASGIKQAIEELRRRSKN